MLFAITALVFVVVFLVYYVFALGGERYSLSDKLRDIGNTVIVIEHDMAFVAEIAHKVTVMHQGKVLAEGPMASVQSNPNVIEVYLGH